MLAYISLLDALGTCKGFGIVFVLLSRLIAGVAPMDCDCEYTLLPEEGGPRWVYRCSLGSSNSSAMVGGLC